MKYCLLDTRCWQWATTRPTQVGRALWEFLSSGTTPHRPRPSTDISTHTGGRQHLRRCWRSPTTSHQSVRSVGRKPFQLCPEPRAKSAGSRSQRCTAGTGRASWCLRRSPATATSKVSPSGKLNEWIIWFSVHLSCYLWGGWAVTLYSEQKFSQWTGIPYHSTPYHSTPHHTTAQHTLPYHMKLFVVIRTIWSLQYDTIAVFPDGHFSLARTVVIVNLNYYMLNECIKN